MNDNLGDRMKRYESVTRHFLVPKLPVILRLDGKAFHTFTRNCEKPFDSSLNHAFVVATHQLLNEIQGSAFAYHQSDEVSILVTDFSSLDAEQWFGGNVQKIISVASSIFTAHFNANYRYKRDTLAYFDCRVFQLPNTVEVVNYFRWRNKDCWRNAISGIAQTMYSDKELHGKSTIERQAMIGDKFDYADPSLIHGNVLQPRSCETVWSYGWDFVNDGGKLARMVPEINYDKRN